MTPFWEDDHLQLWGGDCRAVLQALPAESVHCVVTSPPYWGLRDYGTANWSGGDAACDHLNDNHDRGVLTTTEDGARNKTSAATAEKRRTPMLGTCRKCGAVRIDSQLGLEPTPEAYVENMVAVFREVRRVLRADGTLWLNLGDSYASDLKGSGGTAVSATLANRKSAEGAERSLARQGGFVHRVQHGLKPKDLVGIPWRVAFALQADGWYLRSDIIWAKPNPMPESVTDRPTKAHEYLFLLSKSPRYYFDAEAVREAHTTADRPGERASYRPGSASSMNGGEHVRKSDAGLPLNPAGRNLRSVWTIATEPYPGAHFATFPRKLVEPCVKAGTSERGVCPECGAPWRREVERPATGRGATASQLLGDPVNDRRTAYSLAEKRQAYRAMGLESPPPPITTGWRQTCDHHYIDPFDGPIAPLEPVPAVVLDPFAGSGTTLLVAQALGRRGVGIDLNPDYLKQALARNAQTPLGLVG